MTTHDDLAMTADGYLDGDFTPDPDPRVDPGPVPEDPDGEGMEAASGFSALSEQRYAVVWDDAEGRHTAEPVVIWGDYVSWDYGKRKLGFGAVPLDQVKFVMPTFVVYAALRRTGLYSDTFDAFRRGVVALDPLEDPAPVDPSRPDLPAD